MHTDFPLRKIIVQFCDHIIFTGTTGKFSNGRIWSEWLMLRVTSQTLGIASSKFSVSVYIFTGTICKPGVTKLLMEQNLCFAVIFPVNEGFPLNQVILKFH